MDNTYLHVNRFAVLQFFGFLVVFVFVKIWGMIGFFLSEIGDGGFTRNGSFDSSVQRFEFGKDTVSGHVLVL